MLKTIKKYNYILVTEFINAGVSETVSIFSSEEKEVLILLIVK